MEDYVHGAVLKLTREDNEESVRRHFELMRGCGINTVVIWPAAFWWEELGEGYPFNTGKQVLRLAEEYGLGVIMELAGQLTVMEYIPDFLMKREYYATDIDGNIINGQSSFGFLNYFHPEVKELIAKHFEAAAAAYRDEPALIGYDVFNETMFRSFDEYTMADFYEWLREKYGTVEELNRVWERTYSDFSGIRRDGWKWMSVMPEVDYWIYRKQAIARFLAPWCDAIRRVDGKHMLIADNIHSQVTPAADYDRPHGDFALAEAVDEIGMSFYPKQVGGTMAPDLRWEVFDGFAAAAKRRGFYVSEMQTHIQALFNPQTCVKVEELRHWCLEAYAAGAKGIIYWMWRPFTKGLQTLGRGIVNYRDIPTERYALVSELSDIFSRYGTLRPTRSRVGILYHELSDDMTRAYTASYSVDKAFYNMAVSGAYRAFYDLNARADIITVSELADYEAVVVTNLTALSREDAARLRDYVTDGGIVIADGRVGVVDETSMQYKIIPGGELHKCSGAIYFDTDNGDPTFTMGDGRVVDGFYGRDIVELTDGEVTGTFSDGIPAVIEKKCGTGRYITVNTQLFYGYYKKNFSSVLSFVAHLADRFSLRSAECSDALRIRIAENGKGKLLFAFNYGTERVRDSIKVGDRSYHVTVEPSDVAIVELE